MSEKTTELVVTVELKAKKEREKAEEERKIEANKQAKIQADKDAEIAKLKAVQLAEEKAKLEAEKEAEKLAKAPIKQQLLIWVNNFEIALPKEANETTLEISKKFNSFKSWAKSEIEKL